VTRYRRWNELLELLAAEGQLQVEEAAKALGVSEATVRRDLDELARQQMLTRIRGGAVAQGVTYDLPLRYKSERHPSEKQRIAAVAAGLVRPGQVTGLNGGTTTTEVARALATRSDLNSQVPPPALTVVTNALNIASELAVRPKLKLIATGGLVRSESRRDLRTLAATGASGATRRAITAATAGALGFTGAVVGIVGGYVAAIGFFRSNSLDGLSSLTSIPVTNLLVILVGMPLAAAVLGWLLAGRNRAGIGRRPPELLLSHGSHY